MSINIVEVFERDGVNVDSIHEESNAVLSYLSREVLEDYNDVDDVNRTEVIDRLLDMYSEEADSALVAEDSSVTVKRSANTFDLVDSIVEEYPDANVDQVIRKLGDTVDATRSTLTSYFYRSRKERGLAGTGRVGRRPNDTADRVLSLVSHMKPDNKRDDIIKAISEDIGLTISTSTVYYYNALKRLKS